MIYDSEQEKQFILEAVKKYPTNYETALQLANTYGMSIQHGQVIDIKKQHKAFPPPGTPDQPEAGADNGNRKVRRAAEKADKKAGKNLAGTPQTAKTQEA